MINTQHPHRSTTPQSVTLRDGDSINLTTMVVTRSPRVATANGQGLQRNDLRSLHLALSQSN